VAAKAVEKELDDIFFAANASDEANAKAA